MKTPLLSTQIMTKFRRNTLTNRDRVYLQSLVRRQLLLLKEMYAFHDQHPLLIDEDLVGSYDSLFRIFANMAEQELCLLK